MGQLHLLRLELNCNYICGISKNVVTTLYHRAEFWLSCKPADKRSGLAIEEIAAKAACLKNAKKLQ